MMSRRSWGSDRVWSGHFRASVSQFFSGVGVAGCVVMLLLAAGCKDGLDPDNEKIDTGGDSADSGDSGRDTAEDEPRPGWFDEAELDPPFLHGNAIWAGAAILDFDGAGLQDLFFTNGGNHPDALYRNMGGGRFEDVAMQSGAAVSESHKWCINAAPLAAPSTSKACREACRRSVATP